MGKYDDIIDLPHHVSTTRTPMPLETRAAQFAPFSALTGHEAALAETARLTSARPVLTREESDRLERRIAFAVHKDAEIRVTFFEPDPLKEGGSCRQTIGKIRKIDNAGGYLILDDRSSIPIDNILSIDGGIFSPLED